MEVGDGGGGYSSLSFLGTGVLYWVLVIIITEYEITNTV